MAKSAIDMKIVGIHSTRRALERLGGKHIGYAKKLALLKAGQYLNTEITKNLTVRDHSQQSLANLDHPYAQRHGSIAIHQDKPFIVHSQTGALANTLNYNMRGGIDNPIFRTGLKYNRRYIKYVITGTKVMLPRNVLFATSQQEKVRHQMVLKVEEALKRYLTARQAGGTSR